MAAEAPAHRVGWLPGEHSLAALGRALSDPARVRILALLARGRACCPGAARADSEAPADDALCVCELQAALGMRQSLVSYHLRLLRDAGLVREQRRGRWSFYSLDRQALAEGAAALAALAGVKPQGDTGVAPAASPRPGPTAAGRGVTGMASSGKRDDPARDVPHGSSAGPAADAGCCDDAACCDTGGQGDGCCGEPPAATACCDGC